MATRTGINIDDAKSIRRALKEQLGYNARQVSVRVENYSMGSTTHFTIRDPKVSYKKVKEFSKQCEEVHRCSYSGEILSGGNTYVDMHIKPEVAEVWATKYVYKIRKGFEELQGQANCGLPIDDDLLIWGGQWEGDGMFHLTLRSEPNRTRTCYRSGNDDGFKRAAVDAYLMVNGIQD